MQSSTRARYWMSYLPGMAISLLAVLVAIVMGGPIAAAILAIAAVPSLLLFCVLCFIVLMKYTPAKRIHSLAMGLGLYVVSVCVTLLLLNEFGPSQIM